MMRIVLVSLIKLYKLLISPVLGQNCRFHPGCANYAIEAIEMHGSIRGVGLAIKRIAKCHPLHEGGLDPVPQPKAPSPKSKVHQTPKYSN